MHRAFEDFLQKYNVPLQSRIEVAGRLIDIPVKYSDASAMMVFFPAPLDRIINLLKKKGKDRFKPVNIFRNRGVVGVTIFDYRKCDIGPFREFTISIPVMLDSRLNIPIIPLIFDSIFNKFGFHVVMLGADSEVAREHIEKIFPYPTYKKDIKIDFKEEDNTLFTGLSESGKEIFSLHKKIPQNYKLMRKKYNTYYTKDDKLFKVKLDTISLSGFSKKDHILKVSFGDHEITKMFIDLNVDPTPLRSIYYKKAIEVASFPEEM